MAVGTAAVAYALAFAGYIPGTVTEASRSAIRWSCYGWPLAVFALQFVVMRGWPMDGRHAAIRDEIAARRAEAL